MIDELADPFEGSEDTRPEFYVPPKFCDCLHLDSVECYVLRYADTRRTREELEDDCRMSGGCECVCHGSDYYDDFEDEDGL